MNGTESVVCPVVETDRIERDVKIKGILGTAGWLSKENFVTLQKYQEGDRCPFITFCEEDEVFEIKCITGRIWLTRSEFQLAQNYSLKQ